MRDSSPAGRRNHYRHCKVGLMTQLTPGNKSYYMTRVGVILGKLCKLLTAQSHVGITLLRGSSITLELYNRKILNSPFALVDELSATWRRPAGNCWTWWRCSAHRRWPIKSRCCWVRKRRRPFRTNCNLIWKWKIEKTKTKMAGDLNHFRLFGRRIFSFFFFFLPPLGRDRYSIENGNFFDGIIRASVMGRLTSFHQRYKDGETVSRALSILRATGRIFLFVSFYIAAACCVVWTIRT